MDIELNAERVREVSTRFYSTDVTVTLTMDSDLIRKNVRELVEKMFDWTERDKADFLLMELAKEYLSAEELMQAAEEVA